MTETQLFDFTWQYQPDEEGEQPQPKALEIGDPSEVPPLDINIKNILPDKEITINPIAGATEASATNYHFKLAFDSGILVDPEDIQIEGEDWLIYHSSDANADSLYLLWKGEAITISPNQYLPEKKEIILTGVAAKSGVSHDSQSINLAATTTVVTISWQFKQGDIEVIGISFPEFKRHSPYQTYRNLTLDMVKTTGKSNIPLFVGFVGSNKVLNVNDGTNSLKVRITNTNLPGQNSITFHYDSNPAKCSQLQIMLEAGSDDWVLGSTDEVDNIAVLIEGNQWQQKNKDSVKVGNNIKGYIWTFEPKSSDVVLQPQETMLIDLNNIVTSKPTGETNLYLSYNYIPGYKDGQFICQIEKSPLVYSGTKVGIGTKAPEYMLHVIGDGPMTIENQGEAKIHYKDTNDYQSWQAGTNSDGWYVYDDDYRLVVKKDGNVGIGTNNPSEKLEVNGTTKTTDLTVPGSASINSLNISSKVGIGINYPSEELEVNGTTKTTDLIVTGKVGIGTNYYLSEKLEVNGSFKIAPGNTVTGIPITRFQHYNFDKVYSNRNQEHTFYFENHVIEACPVLTEIDLTYGGGTDHNIQRIKSALWCTTNGNTVTVYCNVDACDNSNNTMYANRIGCLIIAVVSSTTSI